LTPREAQVLERLMQGQTTRQIAEGYGIGHQTVKNYVTVIYEKLGVRGRAQLLGAHHVPASGGLPRSASAAGR
jgi:DNA-binding CsgD family transcriptional regulator